MSTHNIGFYEEISKIILIISPANCVCGRVYCFHVSVRPNESVSVTFCFLNILKNH